MVSKSNCIHDLFFGTDYHSHLGTSKGGLTVWTGKGFARSIHNIQNTQFRARFEDDLPMLTGNLGIGCISDNEPQPLTVRSHLGDYALTTVGRINNIEKLAERLIKEKHIHLMELRDGEVNATELVMNLINEGKDFKEGILNVQNSIDGSMSLLVLTPEGIYGARDLYGRTPLFIGKKQDTYALSFESSAFPNLGYAIEYELGPEKSFCFKRRHRTNISSERQNEDMRLFMGVLRLSFFHVPRRKRRSDAVQKRCHLG